MKIKKAFTMAEAILVMTILGIIATIMITTLKPAKFKEEALRTLGRKVMSEIDTAMTQIMINDTKEGEMHEILAYRTTKGEVISFDGDTGIQDWTATGASDAADSLEKTFKKYLTTTRTEVDADSYCKKDAAGNATGTFSFYLKDGACLGVKMGASAYTSQFPGETDSTDIAATDEDADGKTLLGTIFVDINGDDEPNVFGKDQFAFPVARSGIYYETPNTP